MVEQAETNSQAVVEQLMQSYAHRTGLGNTDHTSRRYLWTDAYAVCNFLGLYNDTGRREILVSAQQLVTQVHWQLGRHRDDDVRTGWISGLDDLEARQHPTIGGLRIGKDLNERKPDEPYEEHLEWEQDGQYFHYLTKWMHALHAMSLYSNDEKYLQWAIELARVAYRKFIYRPTSDHEPHMYWKMSIDLSYPLVLSMGHHDPLDGYITLNQLQASRTRFKATSQPAYDFGREIKDLEELCSGSDKCWATADLLGIGGLASDAYRVANMIVEDALPFKRLLIHLLDDISQSLPLAEHSNTLTMSASYRLAFRELGLAIGLRAIEYLDATLQRHAKRFADIPELEERVKAILYYRPLADKIVRFWQDYAQQTSKSWLAHEDINSVMLASSLAPQGFLLIR